MRPADPVLAALTANGLLLTQDKALPNVVGILTGESLRASWWSHPKAHRIFSVLSELADHPDVLFTKLLYGKDTLVHRSLWPALLAVGSARDKWQVQGLPIDAKRLLERLRKGGGPVRGVGAPVKELERRLLVTTHEIHTESGRHETVLESWQAWSRRVDCAALPSSSRARKALEDATVRLGAPLTSLPWPPRGAANHRRETDRGVSPEPSLKRTRS
jgi:xanthosine utilization system XapX-like protein